MKNQEKKHVEDMQQLKNELDALKDANSKLQKHLAFTMKNHEMQKKDLMKQNEDLKKKLEAVMVSVACIKCTKLSDHIACGLPEYHFNVNCQPALVVLRIAFLGVKECVISLFYSDHQ
jgi:predicted Holliday junction resolvase-like endonuclease